MRQFLFKKSTLIIALGAGMGTILSLIFLASLGRQDAAILGALGGLVVTVVVISDLGTLPQSPPRIVVGGLLGPILLGAILGFLVSLARGGEGVLKLILMGLLVGTAVSLILHLTHRTLPLDLSGPLKSIWRVIGLLMEAATDATQGAIMGAIVGAILGAVGGGIAIVGLFWVALGAAVKGAVMGTIVGAIAGTFGAR